MRLQGGFTGILILVFVVIAVVAGGAYYFGKLSASPKTPATEISQTSKPSTKSTDETADWKTFTNGKLIFKYPTRWEITEDEDGSIDIRIQKPSYSNIENPIKKAELGIEHAAFKKRAEITTLNIENIQKWLKNDGDWDGYELDISPYMVSEYIGYKVIGIACTDYIVFFSNEKSNWSFEIGSCFGVDDLDKEISETVDQMLQTVKILE